MLSRLSIRNGILSLLGLVANTIAEEYELPVFLWGEKGTIRSKVHFAVAGSHKLWNSYVRLKNIYTICGHSAAGGFTVLDTEVFFLEDRLNKSYAELAPLEEGDSLMGRADAVLTPEEATLSYLTKSREARPVWYVERKSPCFYCVMSRYEISRFGKSEEAFEIKN